MLDTASGSALPRSPEDVQVLGPADLRDVADLVAGHRFTDAILHAELSDHDRYRWMGRRRPDGSLAAVHRSLRWGDYLFLKGVFVHPEARGGDHALRLAFALRRLAQQAGLRGIAAWVSEGSPAQLVLAERLRLRRAGDPLHLFALPFAALPEGERTGDSPPSRSFALGRIEDLLSPDRVKGPGEALVPDLLPVPPLAGGPPIAGRRAVLDRDRLLLGALPCAAVSDVAALLAELAPFAAVWEMPEIEIPVPLSAITLMLWLGGRKGRRVSGRPVHVGRYEF